MVWDDGKEGNIFFPDKEIQEVKRKFWAWQLLERKATGFIAEALLRVKTRDQRRKGKLGFFLRAKATN